MQIQQTFTKHSSYFLRYHRFWLLFTEMFNFMLYQEKYYRRIYKGMIYDLSKSLVIDTKCAFLLIIPTVSLNIVYELFSTFFLSHSYVMICSLVGPLLLTTLKNTLKIIKCITIVNSTIRSQFRIIYTYILMIHCVRGVLLIMKDRD